MEKIDQIYLILKYFFQIWIQKENAEEIWKKLLCQDESTLQNILNALENYFQKQILLNKTLIFQLEKITRQFDENVDSFKERLDIENIFNS